MRLIVLPVSQSLQALSIRWWKVTSSPPLLQTFPLQKPFAFSAQSFSHLLLHGCIGLETPFFNHPENKAEGSFWSSLDKELSLTSDSLSFYVCIYMKTNTLYLTTTSTSCSFYCGSRPPFLICDISHIFVVKYLMLNPNCTSIICPPNLARSNDLQSISYSNPKTIPKWKHQNCKRVALVVGAS